MQMKWLRKNHHTIRNWQTNAIIIQDSGIGLTARGLLNRVLAGKYDTQHQTRMQFHFDQYESPRTSIELAYADLRGFDLKEIDFSDITYALDGLNMDGANLSGANMTLARMMNMRVDRNTKLSNVCFVDADLSNMVGDARFHKCKMSGAMLASSLLNYSVFTECEANNMSFRDSTLQHAYIANTNMDFTDFTNTAINRAVFMGVNFRDIQLTKEQLSGITVNGLLIP
mgnify:CR=1 FL=1